MSDDGCRVISDDSRIAGIGAGLLAEMRRNPKTDSRRFFIRELPSKARDDA
jgi:hypothetical protein